jgi:hypothetical protein
MARSAAATVFDTELLFLAERAAAERNAFLSSRRTHQRLSTSAGV